MESSTNQTEEKIVHAQKEEKIVIRKGTYYVVSMFFIMLYLIFMAFNPDVFSMFVPREIAPIGTPIVRGKAAGGGGVGAVWEKDPRTGHFATLDTAIVIDSKSKQLSNITRTLDMLKLTHESFDSFTTADVADDRILISAKKSITSEDVAVLKDFLLKGNTVIFTVLPDNIDDDLAELLGIVSYGGDFDTVSFDIYKDVFLGGSIHAGYPVKTKQVELFGRCKVYASASDNPVINTRETGYDFKNDRNPLIWRTYYETGSICVMNAPFMDELSGSGILTGLIAIARGDFIYPIAGTSTILLENFPFTVSEGETLNRNVFGDRTIYNFTRDIMWPDVFSMSKNFNINFTLFPGNSTGTHELDPRLNFITNELHKIKNSEIGTTDETGVIGGRSTILLKDDSLIKSSYPNNISSVITPSWDGAFTWLDDSTIRLPIITEGTGGAGESDSGYIGGYVADFDYRSAMSAYGIAIHKIDFTPVFAGEVPWNKYTLEISKYLSYLNYFSKQYLEVASMMEATQRIKDYMNTQITTSYASNGIMVDIRGNENEITFILKTNKEIVPPFRPGYSITEIEENVYIVKSSEPQFTLQYK